MLDAATQEKYLKILLKGKTLKVDPSDAIDLVKKYDDLVWEDQMGNSTRSEEFKENLSKIKGKIILKFWTLFKLNSKKILYWCPSDIEDIILLAGASEYDQKEKKYSKTEWKKREEQISFLGDDIKKASVTKPNDTLKVFYERYVNTDNPLANNIFYTVYLKNADSVNCARNTLLSPRPENIRSDAK